MELYIFDLFLNNTLKTFQQICTTWNQIVHIVINARHGRYVLHVRSLRSLDGDTDYYLVKAKVRMKISSQRIKKNETPGQRNIAKLQEVENRGK